MPTTDDDRAHEALGREECLRLLAGAGIGRLAYTRAALPAIRPVSFFLREGDLVIPVRMGNPLVDAVRGAVVAFEADVYDSGARTGWAVTVVGTSHVVPDSMAPDVCLIWVRFGLVEGWRTSLPA